MPRIDLKKFRKLNKVQNEAIKWAKDAVSRLESGDRVDALDSLAIAMAKTRESLNISMNGR